MKPFHFKYLIAPLILIVIMLIAFVLVNFSKQQEFYGERLDKDAVDFTLKDQNGNLFNLTEYRGKIVLMNFGYTNCPDVCPTTLAILRNIIVEVENNDELKVVFITVDPERDTVERLSKYIPYFHKEILGLTGTIEEIEYVTSLYNIIYFKEDEKSENDYLMSHSPSLYLINKKGELFLKYPQDKLDPEKIGSDIKKLI